VIHFRAVVGYGNPEPNPGTDETFPHISPALPSQLEIRVGTARANRVGSALWGDEPDIPD